MAFADIPIRINDHDFSVSAEWFNTIRSELVQAFGQGGYIAVETLQSVPSLGEFTYSAVSFKPLLQVQGSGGPVTTSTTPFGTSHGFSDGKEIILIGLSDSNPVTLEVNDIDNGFFNNGKVILTKGDMITLIWLDTPKRFFKLR